MASDKIIQKLLEHDEQLEFICENMATKNEINALLDGQDQMITILKRLDEERIFTIEWVRRIEKEVEEQKKKIKEHSGLLQKIMSQLKLAH